jgi:putative AlgH/UPF0301 family transcriptional regulator
MSADIKSAPFPSSVVIGIGVIVLARKMVRQCNIQILSAILLLFKVQGWLSSPLNWRTKSQLSSFDARSFSRRFDLSSFYNDFDSDDDEDDDDDDDDADLDQELDGKAMADFRTRMSSLFGNEQSSTTLSSSPVDQLISFAVGGNQHQPEEWARETETVSAGCILVANPAAFCSDFGGTPDPTLLSKYGLTMSPPVELGPDRRADLLPVLIITEHSNQGSRAVLLNRRTGYLLGDLEQQGKTGMSPILEKFCIQPLWFGGVDSVSTGLDMLHLCPSVTSCKLITEDGLYWGGDPSQAQEAMSDPSNERVYTGFDFKFFVQSTSFGSGEVQKNIEQARFYCVNVAKEILFKSRDRMGTRRAKPLWTEIMELLGGKYDDVKNRLYGEENETPDYS